MLPPSKDQSTQADAVWKKAFREDLKHQFGGGAFAFLFCAPLLVWLDIPAIDAVIERWGALGFLAVCGIGLGVIFAISVWLSAKTANKNRNT